MHIVATTILLHFFLFCFFLCNPKYWYCLYLFHSIQEIIIFYGLLVRHLGICNAKGYAKVNSDGNVSFLLLIKWVLIELIFGFHYKADALYQYFVQLSIILFDGSRLSVFTFIYYVFLSQDYDKCELILSDNLFLENFGF